MSVCRLFCCTRPGGGLVTSNTFYDFQVTMNTWHAVGIVTLALLMAVQQSAAYKCYICSWSPASTNRTDICSSDKFLEKAVKVFEGCPHGCEAVSVYDTNGVLQNYYRNCVVKGKTITDDCVDESNEAVRKKVCRCASDLCNSASGVGPGLVLTLAAALATIRRAVYG